jgi:hypothetical protein
MKAVIAQVAATFSFEMEEIDIDGDAVLCARYDHEVPVLFIDGRKAFKYRATVVDLIRKLKRKRRPFLTRVARLTGKDSP